MELLDQSGSLAYVELQNMLEIPHTGKLNYHLKILGDLISKEKQSGRYTLSEKGKVAMALLGKFQSESNSSATLLKMKLKLGVSLVASGAMAALSLFFLVVGVPGSASGISLSCSTGDSCSAISLFATSFTPTMFAAIPLVLSIVAGLGFYKRRTILVWLAASILVIFAIISMFSIGILYFPFAIVLIILSLINKNPPKAMMSSQVPNRM